MVSIDSDNDDDDFIPEVDFKTLSPVWRGKYYQRYQEGLRVVRLADDVAPAFPDDAAVNEALRIYLREHPTSA